MSISPDYQETSGNQALLGLRENLQRFLLYLRKKWFSKYVIVNAAQQTFAKDMGVQRETINSWLKELEAAGAITITRNPFNKFDTCEYRFTPLLKKNWFILRHFYVMLKYAALPISILASPSEPVLTPYKSLTEKETSYFLSSPFSIFKNTLSLSLSQEYQTARVCAREKQPPEKDFKVEMQPVPEWVTPEIKKATELLNLTKWGQIKLTAYPPSAIQHAIQALGVSKGKKDNLFGWFASVCYSWCKQRNMAPDWKSMNQLATEHRMPEDPHFIVEGSTQQKMSAEEKSGKERILEETREKRKAEYIESKRAEHRAWEETKTTKEIEERMAFILPSTERYSPIKDAVEHKKKIIQTLEAKPNINQTERIILEIYKREIGDTSWSPQDQELIDWSKKFLKDVLKQVNFDCREWYEKLLISIDQGPQSPEAKSRELQDGLQKMRELMKQNESVREALKEEGRNDPEAQTVGDGIQHQHGADSVEESRLQFQQESVF